MLHDVRVIGYNFDSSLCDTLPPPTPHSPLPTPHSSVATVVGGRNPLVIYSLCNILRNVKKCIQTRQKRGRG